MRTAAPEWSILVPFGRGAHELLDRSGELEAVSDRYRIVVPGEFGALLTTAFGDVSETTGGGKTVLVAAVQDPQELYGLMDRLRDYGVQIEKVSKIDDSH